MRKKVKPEIIRDGKLSLRFLQILLLISLFVSRPVFGQNNFVPLGNDAYWFADRLTIKSTEDLPFFTNLRPYNRNALLAFAVKEDSVDNALTKQDEWDLRWIFRDNNEFLVPTHTGKTLTEKSSEFYDREYIDSTKVFYALSEAEINKRYETRAPIFKRFYKTPANLFELDTKWLTLRLNPILNFQYANARNDRQPVFKNQRGVELRGSIDNRIYFYTNFIENQARFANYVNEFVDKNGSLPGAGTIKPYKSNVFDIERGYDFPLSTAVLGFNISPHVGVRFGHGNNFIGDGYRSTFLSDFAGNYFFLQLNWNIWKLHLQNTFAELSGSSANEGGNLIRPKKYIAQHYLGYKFTPNFRLGLVESVVFQRDDGFELQYLNPIILYRAVEFFIGSPDNVMLGLDLRWDILNRFRLYGQFNFDEFIFNELVLERRGSWTNKYAAQIGLKYVDAFGVDHLDLQVEHNFARPYTYQHFDSLSNFSHYNVPLAHPLGANFSETMFRFRYRPFPKLYIDAKYFTVVQGESADGLNVGESLLFDYTTRDNGTGIRDFGHEQNQGIRASINTFSIDVSYQFFHNMYVDLSYFRRNKNSRDDAFDLFTEYFGGGLRMNLGRVRDEF